jgi:hypothetical protein
MENQARKLNLWEAIQAAGAKSQKQRPVSVAPAAPPPTPRNQIEFGVTSSGDNEVADGLQTLVALDAIARAAKVHCCMGMICMRLKPGDRPMCGGSGKPVAGVFSQERCCPEDNWRRFGGYASSPETAAKCRVCGGNTWWRTKSMESWICGNCHPPIVPSSQCVFTGQDLAGETAQ